ncbi:scopoletin glucosyltransferase-like [Impatiens glandulifera]|uniref:scopoletin glucosyltransferase-like n=1 Tax=Impatiens glandulifera TaxID=253017 RepID=UPI001FB07D04|nr:scopoletin glucosyltransferase-like [Impatiens glandulifera]
MEPLPTCMISDRFIPQISGIVERLGLKRTIFDGTEWVVQIHFLFLVYPHEIELTRKQISNFTYPELPSVLEYLDKIREVNHRSYGIIINNFQELEPDYIMELQKIYKNRARCVGPLSLGTKEKKENAIRGNNTAIKEHKCLKWINNQDSGSVIYHVLEA